MVGAVATAAAMVLAACGGTTTVSVPGVDAPAPADLLLERAELPEGFNVEELSVPELVEGNQASFDAAEYSEVDPDFCRPTADAGFNTLLRPDNAAVLAARSRGAGLVQVISTRERDLTADRRTSTGRCATNTTTLTGGNLAGTRIVTEYTEISLPTLANPDRVRESLMLRSQVTTTFPDGGIRTQIGYAAYALIDWPDPDGAATDAAATDATAEPADTQSSGTVQLTVSGATTEAQLPGPDGAAPVATDPSSEAEFATLVVGALDAATAD